MRLHLTLALITFIALVVTLRAAKQHPFGFANVDQLARKRAAAAYVPLPDALPPQLKKFTPQQDGGIFWKDTYRLWRKKGLPFQIDFYPQLNSNPLPHIAPEINTVDRKGSHPLGYSPLFFNFFNFATNPPSPIIFNPPLPTTSGYAGFYVRYPNLAIGSNPRSLDGFFSVLGSNYFRAIAKDQVYGLSGRALAINTGIDGKTEEFPVFTNWWLQEPAPSDTALTLYALLDGPSVSGAYQFTLHPGGVTSVDIHASLYFRQKIDRLGLAPFSSMYLFGENANNHFNDRFHPEIHDSDGVLLNNGSNEWVWRPLGQDNQLQLYNFLDANPRGFGLVQRDRDFQHYQDWKLNYNVRPSAWVIPHGDWGKGTIQLIHRPSNDFNIDNVVLLWNPDKTVKAGDHLDVNYTIDFYMNDAARPPLAYCKQTLINNPAPPPPPAIPVIGLAANPKTNSSGTAQPSSVKSGGLMPPNSNAPVIPTGTTPVQFVIDFIGNGIENTPADQPPDPDLTMSPEGTYLRDKKVEKNNFDNSWRVTFTIIPLKHSVPTELRCRLMRYGKPISETWSYTWNQ